MSARILVGDLRERLNELPADSFDSVVTDPPYELAFMGKKWDRSGVAFDPTAWAAVLRVMKPGAYLVAFGGTRTHHRMYCAIEDAGFVVHDTLAWLFGSGFPKHDSKLKPSWEPICLASKPGERATPLQIDACRVGDDESGWGGRASTGYGHRENGRKALGSTEPGGRPVTGRWPANVVLDEEAAALVDEQTGQLTSGANPTRRGSPKTRNTYGEFEGQRECVAHRGANAGGASRFYYCAKASRAEREFGCEGLARGALNWSSGTQSPGTFQSEGTDKTARNNHPTVKPVALMRWLARLITPPRGHVLDPFGGSGSTACACSDEMLECTLIEIDERYAEIARARTAAWSSQQNLFAAASEAGA